MAATADYSCVGKGTEGVVMHGDHTEPQTLGRLVEFV